MPKGYWIARVDIRDAERYKDYVAAAKLAFDRFGAKFLARGGEHEVAEGPGRARNVIIEFDSLATARECYHSPEYQVAAALVNANALAFFHECQRVAYGQFNSLSTGRRRHSWRRPWFAGACAQPRGGKRAGVLRLP
jgi:uncharacterized protein (DUF1330 family)